MSTIKSLVKKSIYTNKILLGSLALLSIVGLIDHAKNLSFNQSGIISFLVKLTNISFTFTVFSVIIVLITILLNRFARKHA